MASARDNGYAVSTAMSGAAAVVADPHRADQRGKRRDKEVEVKQQRAGQSDGRCELGHRRAGLAARPLIDPTGALSWAMAIRHSATPASVAAMDWRFVDAGRGCRCRPRDGV